MKEELIEDLIKLCNENFLSPHIQPYAGGNFECMYCGATRTNTGTDHSVADCPVNKFQDILYKHKKILRK